MILRSLLAAALIASATSTSSAALGDCGWSSPTPDVLNFPRPMPSRIALPEKLDNVWQLLQDWVRPKLGLSPIAPVEMH